jgi:hypothetical protein
MYFWVKLRACRGWVVVDRGAPFQAAYNVLKAALIPFRDKDENFCCCGVAFWESCHAPRPTVVLKSSLTLFSTFAC